MMWHRYRWLLVAAPLLGFLLGVVLWAATDLARSRQYRQDFDLSDAAWSALPLGAIGTAVAIAALAGGWSFVAARDRRLVQTPGERSFLASVGGVLGVLVLALAVGLVVGFTDGFIWYGLFLVSIPVSVATAIAAGTLVYLADRWHLRVPSPPVEHVAASPWTDF